MTTRPGARGTRRLTTGSLAGALLLAAACGGGGGSTGGPPAATHVTPDDGGTEVALGVVPTITADAVLLDCSSVSATSFTLAVDGGAAVAGSVACAAQTATFTPGAALAPSTRYQARVTGLKDAAGVVLCQACAWKFTTRAAVAAAPRTIGGTLSGLTGTGLVLRNNDGGDLPLASNGAFTFVATLDDGAGYAVKVRTQPRGQACDVTRGAGTVAGANVTDVAVTCRARATAPVAFLYFPHAHPTLHTVSLFGIDETGGLAPLSPATLETGNSPVLTADPSGRNLYVTVAAGVTRYSIATDGSLTAQETTTPPRPVARQLLFHPAGLHAYLLSCTDAFCADSQYDLYTVGAGGALGATSSGVVATGDQLTATFDPSGLHAYTVSKFTENSTASFRVLARAVQADGTWATGLDPLYYHQYVSVPVIEPAGTFAYFWGTGLYDRYPIEAGGALGPRTALGVGVGGTTSAIAFHPSGQFAYADGMSDGDVTQFTVGADGALTSQGTVATLGLTLGGVVLDPTGRFAYVSSVPLGHSTRGIVQYDVDAQGKLVPMSEPVVVTSLGGWPNQNLVIVPAR